MTDEAGSRDPQSPDEPADPWAGADHDDLGAVPPDAPAGEPAGTEPRQGPETGPGMTETQPITPAAPEPAGPTGTSILPTVPTASPTWSARAQVPQPARDMGPPDGDDWHDQESRSLGMPILIGAAVIILLALVGLGVFLILRGGNASVPPPASVTVTSGPPQTSTVTSSAPRTTTAPPTTQTTTLPPTAVVPGDLVGQDATTATAELNALKLKVTTVSQNSPDVPVGAVISSNPDAGATVFVGSTVTLVVSAGPPSPPPSPTAPAS